MIRRREFITLLGGAAAASTGVPWSAHAQIRPRPLIGTLSGSSAGNAAANKSLRDGDRIIASFPASAAADTTVARLKIQLAAQRSAVVKACDAMKRVAEQRGEPLPNCGT